MGNPRYIKNRCGVIKILTIIIGILSISLTAYSCDREWKEELYLGIVIACLVISILYLIVHFVVSDIELKTSNKGLDSGYHFLGALLLLCGGILMVYSAVDLRYDIWYFCSYGLGRGIPCLSNNRYRNDYNPVIPGGIGIPGLLPQQPNTQYGPVHNKFNKYESPAGSGRSFLHQKWINLIGSGLEICYEVVAKLLDCNRYYELKMAGGILGILNAILYGVTGIMVLLSN